MLSKILALLAKLDVQKLKDAMAAISVIVNLFGAIAPVQPGSAGNLETVQLSDEDNANVEKITQALSEESGTQAAFDLQKLLRFVAILRGMFGAAQAS
jgi:hypothetical protein